MHALQILEIASVLYQERIDTNVRSHDNSEVKVTTRENSRELNHIKEARNSYMTLYVMTSIALIHETKNNQPNTWRKMTRHDMTGIINSAIKKEQETRS